MRAFLLLALCLAPLAGCLDPEGGGGPGASAMDLRAAADREAAQWDASASLWGVVGAEWNRSLEALEFEDSSPAEKGKDIGDGEAPGWSYLYVNEDDQVRLIRLLDDGSVAASDEWAGEPMGDEGPIGDWRIDSDEAARRLAEANATFRTLTQAGAQVAWLLAAHEPMGMDDDDGEDDEAHGHAGQMEPPASHAAAWTALVVGPAETDLTLFLLDAVDGEYLGAQTLDALLPDVDPEFGSSAGMLTVTSSAEATPLTIEMDGHPNLRVRFSATGSGIATVRVVGPGLPAPVEAQWGPLPGDVEIDVPMPVAGEWQVEVQLDVGTALPYQVEWCAEGASMGLPQDC